MKIERKARKFLVQFMNEISNVTQITYIDSLDCFGHHNTNAMGFQRAPFKLLTFQISPFKVIHPKSENVILLFRPKKSAEKVREFVRRNFALKVRKS